VVDALFSTGAISTINDLSFECRDRGEADLLQSARLR
jgi:hypothetical protein